LSSCAEELIELVGDVLIVKRGAVGEWRSVVDAS